MDVKTAMETITKLPSMDTLDKRTKPMTKFKMPKMRLPKSQAPRVRVRTPKVK